MCSCSRSSSLEKEWSSWCSPRWIHPPPSSDDDVDLEKGTRSGVSARLFSPPTLKKVGAVSLTCVYVFSLSLRPHFVCFVRILLLLLLLFSYIRNHFLCKKRSKNEELSSLFVSSYKNRRKIIKSWAEKQNSRRSKRWWKSPVRTKRTCSLFCRNPAATKR